MLYDMERRENGGRKGAQIGLPGSKCPVSCPSQGTLKMGGVTDKSGFLITWKSAWILNEKLLMLFTS